MTLRLVADIGGTSSRFAIARDGATGEPVRLATASFECFGDALDEALEKLGRGQPDEAAVAAAGPRFGDAIDLTNVPWRIEATAVSSRLGGVPVRLANDLEAVALALPHLGAADVTVLQDGTPGHRLPMIAVNVGTGFGAAVVVPCGEGWTALGGEPGHMTLGAVDQDERAMFGPAQSVEDVLSGPGLLALARRAGSPVADAAGVLSATDAASRKAAGVFARLLGRIAGDLVLATGAWGGVYLCGGVAAEPHGAEFDKGLLTAFADKAKMTRLMKRVPVARLTRQNPALLGLARLGAP